MPTGVKDTHSRTRASQEPDPAPEQESTEIEEEPSLKEEDLAFSPEASVEPIANSALVEVVASNRHPAGMDAGTRQLSLS